MKIDRMIGRLDWVAASLIAAAFVGCAESSPPPFRLDMTRVVAQGVSADNQLAIANTLEAMFGTPNEPFALPETGLDERKLKMAAGPVWGNRPGVKRGLYRRHCAHCHGINGDGHGPTAAILNPYPRDYRPGVFKFKSTYLPNEPTIEDLRRVVNEGVPGTAMPAFVLLPPDEVDALVEYVKYLSIRGQMETALISFVAMDLEEGETLDPMKYREVIVGELLAEIAGAWNTAPENVIVPAPDSIPPVNRTPEQVTASVEVGRELFYSATKGNCMQCHGPTGLGDGQQTAYDTWSDATQKFIQETNDMLTAMETKKQEIASLTGDELTAAREELEADKREYDERRALANHLLRPRTAFPRNLRENTYRGGRRAIDLYWRISAGVAGTPMPGGGPAAPGAPATLTEQEIWQIVDYVQSLPFEPASRPQRRPVNVKAVIN